MRRRVASAKGAMVAFDPKAAVKRRFQEMADVVSDVDASVLAAPATREELAAELEACGAEPCEGCGYSLNEIRDLVCVVRAARQFRRVDAKHAQGSAAYAKAVVDLFSALDDLDAASTDEPNERSK